MIRQTRQRQKEEPKDREPGSCAQSAKGEYEADLKIEGTARQGAVRRRRGSKAVAMEDRPEGEHQAQPEIPTWQDEILIVSHGRAAVGGIPTSDEKGVVFRSGPKAGADDQLRPCPRGRLRAFLGVSSSFPILRKGRGACEASDRPIPAKPRWGLIKTPCGQVLSTLTPYLRQKALPSIGDHQGGFREPGGVLPRARPAAPGLLISPARVPSSTSISWTADLQRLAHRQRQVSLPYAPVNLIRPLGSFSSEPRVTL